MFRSPLDHGSEFAAVSFDFCLLWGSEAHASAESLIFESRTTVRQVLEAGHLPGRFLVWDSYGNVTMIDNIVGYTTFGVRAVPDPRTQTRTSGQEIKWELNSRRYVSVRTRTSCSFKAEQPS